MKLRHIIIVLVVLLLGVGGYFASALYHTVNTTIPNAYAVEWVGSIVVEYLRQNEDRWPHSWDDLRPIYEQHVEEVGQPWSFEELKSRVIVRWDVDVERVRQLSAPPDDLIYLRDGGDEHWAGHEPSTMVHEYLTQPTPANQGLQ